MIMSPRRAAWSISAFYAAVFAAVGVYLPFWPLWLQDRGLSPTEIGLVMAVTYLTRIVANPAIGAVVDRRGDRKRPMLVLSLLTALGWMAFEPAHGLVAIIVVTMVAVAPMACILPVGDTLAMMAVNTHRLDYGRLRLWGSLAFIAAATLVGYLLEIFPPAILPWLIAGLMAVTALSCLALPDARVPSAGKTCAPLAPLLKAPAFLLFLAAGALNQAAHTVYYSFATIHWKAAGLSDTAVGLLWSEGVLAEIVLFLFSGAAVRRAGPAGLLLAAGLGGALRWLVLGSTVEVGWLVAAQILHAATFGCAHLAAMHFIPRAVPPGLAVRAIGVYGALAIGLAPGLMTPLTGRLFEWLGGGSFLVMAALSAGSAAAGWALSRRWSGGRVVGE